MDLCVHVRQERMIDYAPRADHQRLAQRFTDAARCAAENREVTPMAHRAALEHRNGGFLQDRISRKQPIGDAAEFNDRDGGVFLHQIDWGSACRCRPRALTRRSVRAASFIRS